MLRFLLTLALTTSVIWSGQEQRAHAVVIGGKWEGSFWEQAAPGKLAAAEHGVADTGGEVWATIYGRYLYLGARLPEPTGRLTARSIGKNPFWEDEDAIVFTIRVANENDWRLKVGPLGAYSVQWRWTGESDWYTSLPEKCEGFLVAAAPGDREWHVQAAIPLSELGSPRRGDVHVSMERIRTARPATPEERWHWPNAALMAAVPGNPAKNIPDPVFAPATLGNSELPIEAGHRGSIPPLNDDWNDDPWRNVPVWRLYRNEASSRLPVFQTEVKIMQDGHTLAVMARCAEPFHPVSAANQRDDQIDEDDNFQVYLATSGSAYVKYAVNPGGYVLDASGFSGGERISRPHLDWNSPVRATARVERGQWIARLDIPLDSVASALGEARTPRDWRVLLVRHRPGRSGEPQETPVLPVTQSVTPYCPARYRWLVLSDRDPSDLKGMQAPAPAGNLAFAPTRVLAAGQRSEMALSEMLDRNIHDRTLGFLESERQQWNRVESRQDWENFRNRRRNALAASIGALPAPGALQTRVFHEFQGDGYRREDLAYQSQPGVWVTANLYLPSKSKPQMPAIIIVHSLHWSKTQFELQDMGILWARAGCAVLVMDQAGYGERIEAYPWNRDDYHSRYVAGMQLYLVGESLIKWMVWDVMRGVDLLVERKDINKDQIILLGSVAGGGDPAAVAAALDDRVAAVVPFNFGESTPEIPRFIPAKNQWPLEVADPGLGDWDTTRCLRRGVVDQFLQWTICAMAAPRRFVYSYELGWNVEELPAWDRYKKVFDLYGARDHLADAHGFGPFPGPGECWNIGPAQRRSLYPTLERWFGIPVPFDQMRSVPYANLARVPNDRRPESELRVLTPETAPGLQMKTIHELSEDIGRSKLTAARAALAQLPAEQRRDFLRRKVAALLGDIQPNTNPAPVTYWTKALPGASVEGLTVTSERGITVPLLLLRPSGKHESRVSVVVGIAEGGKDLFLSQRSSEVMALLAKGIAVCLPDVRGTGETSPDNRRDPENDENMQAVNEEMLGETLLGRRLKDFRTVVQYLRHRPDIDPARIGIWGESLNPVNSATIIEDEQPLWQVGPQIQQQSEPLGGLLAILGGLYESDIRAIAVRGGLISYSSILEDAFAYVPADITVPGLLEIADLADIEGAIAPRPILLEDLTDAKDRLVSNQDIKMQLGPAIDAYNAAPANLAIRMGQQERHVADWLIHQM
jgi:cephalosporin-C deacetylase-like acetyl esterase